MDKLKEIRRQFPRYSIDALLVPSSDEFLNEYVPENLRRLEWLTGFTGSSGTALILKSKVVFFTDGRYTLQAKKQLPKDYIICDVANETPISWLKKKNKNLIVGVDAWLHTKTEIDQYKKAAVKIKDIGNLIDLIWYDKPMINSSRAFSHDIKYSGQSSVFKVKNVVKKILEYGSDYLLVADSSCICWMLNVRGGDVKHTPLLLSYALVSKKGDVSLFCDKNKLDKKLIKQLGSKVRIFSIGKISTQIKKLKSRSVIIDPRATNYALYSMLYKSDANIIEGENPCVLLKAIKNDTEIIGTKNAHLRDGAALTKFLCWLDESIKKEKITELSAAEKLEEFRRSNKELADLSFTTISGYGSNGAIVHYSVTPQSSQTLKPEGLYLVDSGGQYLDGTTDVTRTIALGKPTDEQKTNFTLVLKGHIALASVIFPKGTRGCDLDVLARAPLWSAGLNYSHGTGHGVGSFLSVHEGPQGISSRSTAELHPGMIISNEPGYYKEGEYGIRIESLVIVVQKEDYLGFETITMAPIDTKLINKKLLSRDEKNWINEYHELVYKSLYKKLDAKTKKWLKVKTKPLG